MILSVRPRESGDPELSTASRGREVMDSRFRGNERSLRLDVSPATRPYQTASRSFTAPSRSTETSCDTPRSAMVTP
jgi:hypothetical protein